ncbi:hypothetical protein [Spongiactinospora sp. TRM90649]|uniref:hypothetical protein n=1 Tax=Spongiactinospora sp. TRM90649 TaxID=3031114 RepID=UPI0023F80105|nr:hypothetical protein [Spongiactinospora sp. TRM90649]MDF5752927.1 hypothetical protein [Spongiactinospora sp. TRM90649]
MNPNMVVQLTEMAVAAGGDPEDEADKLIQLRNALLELQVSAELRDNGAALLIRRPVPGAPVWVFVGYGGVYFSWQSAERRHPVADVDGAAQVLAKYIAR